MTTEELLVPRYKVIADFPHNNYYKVGGTIWDDGKTACRNENGVPVYACEFSEFPNVFKRLQWWEERNANEMPKYVKSLADERGDIFIIQEWDMEMLIGWIDKKERSCASLTIFKPEYGYFPSTEAEYNAQCQTKS